jgi:hypothetical protein
MTSQAQREAGVWERQPPSAKCFVARGSEPSTSQAEHSGKRGFGGVSPLPAKRLVARGSEPSVRQAERSGKRGFGGGSPHQRLKNPEGWLYSRNNPRVHERKAPGRAPADGAAGIAIGRAGTWGQRAQLLSNARVHTNGHRLFDSVEHSPGRAPADDAAGQALQNNCAMRLLSRRRRRDASHAGGVLITAT